MRGWGSRVVGSEPRVMVISWALTDAAENTTTASSRLIQIHGRIVFIFSSLQIIPLGSKWQVGIG